MFERKKLPLVPPFGDILASDDGDIEILNLKHAARSGFWAETWLLFRDLLFALMFAVLLVVFVVQPVKVEGVSMEPNLHDGQRIFVNKLIYYGVYYGMPKLSRGDIIVFWYPNNPNNSYVKRVIGFPGETVEVRQGRVIINNQILDEPYLSKDLNLSTNSKSPVLVADHYYYVMGDNRDHSSDSRMWGLVPEKYIYGKALFRYWPLNEVGGLAHAQHYNIAPPPERSHEDDEP